MKYYTTIIRASVALAALAALVAFAPQANALTSDQTSNLNNAVQDNTKGRRLSDTQKAASLAAAAKSLLNNLTGDAKTALAKDIVKYLATAFPRYVSVVVGNLAKADPASAPALAQTAAQANSEVAVAVAKSAAAGAPAYAAQITTQVTAILQAGGLSTAGIADAVVAGAAQGNSGEVAQNTVINNPSDVSTSAR